MGKPKARRTPREVVAKLATCKYPCGWCLGAKAKFDTEAELEHHIAQSKLCRSARLSAALVPRQPLRDRTAATQPASASGPAPQPSQAGPAPAPRKDVLDGQQIPDNPDQTELEPAEPQPDQLEPAGPQPDQLPEPSRATAPGEPAGAAFPAKGCTVSQLTGLAWCLGRLRAKQPLSRSMLLLQLDLQLDGVVGAQGLQSLAMAQVPPAGLCWIQVAERLGPELSAARTQHYCEPLVQDAEPESDMDLDSLTPGALAMVKVLAKLSVADRRDVLAYRNVVLPFNTEEQFQAYVMPEMVSSSPGCTCCPEACPTCLCTA